MLEAFPHEQADVVLFGVGVAVDTGDDNNIIPYGIAMILALAGLGIVAKKKTN